MCLKRPPSNRMGAVFLQAGRIAGAGCPVFKKKDMVFQEMLFRAVRSKVCKR